jgi:hypothetical protein
MMNAMEPEGVQLVAEKKSEPRRRTRLFHSVPGDIEIFRYLSEYRLLCRDHLSALTGRDPKRLHRRILKLLESGHLKRIKLPLAPHIYFLGPDAIPVLLNHGILNERDVKRRREHELGPDFLQHEMLISSIHIALDLAGRASHVKLSNWQQGKEELTDAITDMHGRRTLCPDAFFILEDTMRPAGENRRGFLLEADRSSMSRAGQMTEKYARYRDYIAASLHQKKYGIQSVRVVTVTETRARAESLCALVAETLPRDFQKFFRFGTLGDFSLDEPAAILGAAFIHPHDFRGGKRYELMPAPAVRVRVSSQAADGAKDATDRRASRS